MDDTIDFFDVIDVDQYHAAADGCRGTDDDIAAAENLLNQSLRIADTLNFLEPERLIEPRQDSALAGDTPVAHDIKLIFAQKHDMQNPDCDQRRDQNHSKGDDARIHFAAVPDCSGDTAGKQSSQAHGKRDADGIPDCIPYVFNDEKELIAFDLVQNFFVFCFVHGDLLCFVLRPRRGQNMKEGERAFSPQ